MGQRSQIYVRHNGRLIIANYYQWNYAERMISRARWGIEYLEEFVNNKYDWAFRDKSYITRFSRIFDTNFDMRDVAISRDIVKEYFDLFPEDDFNDCVFNNQDNNDGQLFVDIKDGKILYCFRDLDENTIMDAEEYMSWDCPNWKESRYTDADQKATCAENIKAIEGLAELMTREQLDDFLTGNYKDAE